MFVRIITQQSVEKSGSHTLYCSEQSRNMLSSSGTERSNSKLEFLTVAWKPIVEFNRLIVESPPLSHHNGGTRAGGDTISNHYTFFFFHALRESRIWAKLMSSTGGALWRSEDTDPRYEQTVNQESTWNRSVWSAEILLGCISCIQAC